MKKLIAFSFIILFFCADGKKVKEKSDGAISAEQAILIDCDTGECFFEKNGDARCVPSSMTKLLTLYILFSAISEGRIKMQDEFPVSMEAQKMQGSRSFFQAGTMAKVEDLIRSIVVHSGNDACVVVAEKMFGDVDAFAQAMNDKAKEFRLKNSNFTNPAGMPDEGHFSCVHDLAIIAQRIIHDFPQYYHYFSEKTFTVNSITQNNRNTLLGNSLNIDGLKTGKTNAGGYGIVVSAKNDGKRLIVVVNGCKDAKSRAQDANKLLALGFREFSSTGIAESGKPITEVAVWLGVKDKVKLCTHEDVIASVPKKYQNSLKVEVTMKEPVDAPIALGTKLGELVYRYDSFVSPKYDLFPCEPVEKANFWERAKFSLKHLIFGNGNADTQAEVKKIDINK